MKIELWPHKREFFTPLKVFDFIRGSTYFDVISDVARLLDTNVYTRSRQINETVCYSYFFVAASRRSKTILRQYFAKYPLYSSKLLDYEDWCHIVDLDPSKKGPAVIDPGFAMSFAEQDHAQSVIAALQKSQIRYMDVLLTRCMLLAN